MKGIFCCSSLCYEKEKFCKDLLDLDLSLVETTLPGNLELEGRQSVLHLPLSGTVWKDKGLAGTVESQPRASAIKF